LLAKGTPFGAQNQIVWGIVSELFSEVQTSTFTSTDPADRITTGSVRWIGELDGIIIGI
jgi:hypothetical protein